MNERTKNTAFLKYLQSATEKVQQIQVQEQSDVQK